MVKGINEGDGVIYGTEKNKKVKDFFLQKLYKWEQKPKEIINNGSFNYEIEIDKAFWRIAKDKATGWDNIPGEFFKALSKSEELKQFHRICYEWKDSWLLHESEINSTKQRG